MIRGKRCCSPFLPSYRHIRVDLHLMKIAIVPGGVFAVLAGGKSADALLDCKGSANRLFMPAPVAVAHGDANLAIDDFLKSVS